MILTLSEKDLLPIDGYPFQNWGARMGMPFDAMRPLSEPAAARAWHRALGVLHGESALAAELDLASSGDWTVPGVRDWLLARHPDRGAVVIAVYHPQWAVAMEWGVICDHWLTVMWTETALLGEGWAMHHDGECFRVLATASER